MTIYFKELRQSRKAFLIWTISIAAMMFLCIIIFPEMKTEMDSVSDVFAKMGKFTQAFGMDKLSFGELMGFYGIECGNVVGIGGGFFAALTGISVLADEEKGRTAEFLLTHPVSRTSVLTQKLIFVLTRIFLLNAVVVLTSTVASALINEKFPAKEFLLLHIAYLIMQIEISCICFGISAFIKRGGIGAGLGTALVMYCINLVCNMSEKVEFLKYITPYAYCDASNIISKSELDAKLIIIGMIISVVSVITGYVKYIKKDIAA
ncbi:MAG: ABC transporter permease subunit [Oscillospiraceae bacterium]|nr:ABC transporter permease subunit [Oscillospiraceae bacterium]